MTAVTMHLRPYATEDEEAAIALWQRSWQAAYPDIDFAERLTWWRTRWSGELVPGATIIVAEADAVFSGFVTVDSEGYVDQLVVAPERWGSGLAAALICEAKRISPSLLELHVNQDNSRALRFYGRHEFVILRDDINPRSGKPVHFMRWTPKD